LLNIYRGLDIINKYVEHYNETKYGVLLVTSGAIEIRKTVRKMLKGHLIPKTEQMIKDFLKSM